MQREFLLIFQHICMNTFKDLGLIANTVLNAVFVKVILCVLVIIYLFIGRFFINRIVCLMNV